MLENEKREFLPDIIKVTGIFMVVWIHSIQYLNNFNYNFFEDVFYKWITVFNMPLFTFISGYFFSKTINRYTNKVFILKKKFNTLIVPCIFWSIALSFMHLIFDYKLTFSIINIIYAIVRDSVGNFWFLKSIFLGSLIVILLEKANFYNRGIYFIISILFFYLFPPLYIVFILPFFYLGFNYGKYYKSIHVPFRLFVFSCVGYVIFLLFFEVEHNAIMHSMNFLYVCKTEINYIGLLKRYFAATLGILMFIGLLERVKLTSFVKKIICRISSNTGTIYIISSIVFYLINTMIKTMDIVIDIDLNIVLYDIFLLIPFTIFLISLCMVINRYLGRYPLLKKLMFGR